MFSLEELKDRIFLLTFENNYDLAMHFLRYQEYYESPNPQFKRQQFTIVDYMEWYAKDKDHNGIFSYPDDWSGFNVPGKIFDKIFENDILDENKYDKFMRSMYNMIRARTEDKFYIIGATKNNDNVIDHEVAHGLWYMDESYKAEMVGNIQKLGRADKPIYTQIFNILRRLGYDAEPDIAHDEMQAYLSTGFTEDMESKLRKAGADVDKISEPFIKTYEKYVR